MKSAIRIAVWGVIGAVTASASAMAGAGLPKLRIAPEFFDFGYVAEGHRVFYQFWLANDGTDTLRISKVKPHCGCTTAPLEADRVAPGDSVPVVVGFNTSKFRGVVNKLVRVHSNDETKPTGDFSFTARVAEPDPTHVIEPAAIRFEDIEPDQQVLVIKSNDPWQSVIRLLAAPAKYIDWRLEGDSLVAPGGTVSLILKPSSHSPVGLYETSLTLWIEGRHSHSVTIPIRGTGYIQ